MRYVGDEIATRRLRPPQVGYVLEQQERPLAVRQARGGNLDPASWRRQDRAQLDDAGDRRWSACRARDLDKLGVVGDFGQRTATRHGRGQEPRRGWIGQLDALVGVEDQHAVGHVPEGGGHLRAVALQLGQRALQATVRRTQRVHQRHHF